MQPMTKGFNEMLRHINELQPKKRRNHCPSPPVLSIFPLVVMRVKCNKICFLFFNIYILHYSTCNGETDTQHYQSNAELRKVFYEGHIPTSSIQLKCITPANSCGTDLFIIILVSGIWSLTLSFSLAYYKLSTERIGE